MPERLIIKSDFSRQDDWHEAFSSKDVEIYLWDDVVDPDTIDYALVWEPEPGALARFSNLKLVFSIGAGVDHLMGSDILPEDIPVVRMVEESLTAGMVEYVVYQVLRFHRHMQQYDTLQRFKHWQTTVQVPAASRNIGILGFGTLGEACAQALSPFGFSISGWSRTEKALNEIKHYHGWGQLGDFLGRCDILVCLLPLTDQTRGILNRHTLNSLPKRSCLINAGRGGHQVEKDILACLETGQLAAAALDVFENEPLPSSSPLWDHPNVTITPHIASMTTPQFSADHVYNNIQRYRNGEPLTHVADMTRGY